MRRLVLLAFLFAFAITILAACTELTSPPAGDGSNEDPPATEEPHDPSPTPDPNDGEEGEDEKDRDEGAEGGSEPDAPPAPSAPGPERVWRHELDPGYELHDGDAMFIDGFAVTPADTIHVLSNSASEAHQTLYTVLGKSGAVVHQEILDYSAQGDFVDDPLVLSDETLLIPHASLQVNYFMRVDARGKSIPGSFSFGREHGADDVVHDLDVDPEDNIYALLWDADTDSGYLHRFSAHSTTETFKPDWTSDLFAADNTVSQVAVHRGPTMDLGVVLHLVPSSGNSPIYATFFDPATGAIHAAEVPIVETRGHFNSWFTTDFTPSGDLVLAATIYDVPPDGTQDLLIARFDMPQVLEELKKGTPPSEITFLANDDRVISGDPSAPDRVHDIHVVSNDRYLVAGVSENFGSSIWPGAKGEGNSFIAAYNQNLETDWVLLRAGDELGSNTRAVGYTPDLGYVIGGWREQRDEAAGTRTSGWVERYSDDPNEKSDPSS